MRILVAEDNEDSRVLLTSFLQAHGYTVDAAANGREALSAATANTPDLIISDILMPEMDGYALCRACKEDEVLRSVPFIFYTATYTDAADERFAMALGASKFIIKPTDMDALLLDVQALIEQCRQRAIPVPEAPRAAPDEIAREYAAILSKKLDKKTRELDQERQRLKISLHRYQRLVETLHEDHFFYTCEADGGMSYVSPSIVNVLGYSQQEFLLRHEALRSANPVNETARRHRLASLRGERQPMYEMELLHKDGTPHRLEVTEEPVFDKNGEVVTVEGIAHDITERLRVEEERRELERLLQQAQKLEAIGTLAGGIAHDFNNILTPIIGYTELIHNNIAAHDPDNAALLQEVLAAAYRAKKLTRQILTFSRGGDEDKKIVFLQPIIKEALKLLRSSIPATVEIRQEIDPDCGMVEADQTKIHQLLMNLCTNAYHAVKDGGVITVSLRGQRIEAAQYTASQTPPPGCYVRIGVSDNGPGIAKQHLERIFEPYFTTKAKDQGTGLGLAVVHGIVKSHGGHIFVESEAGKGTAFLVYLPTAEPCGQREDAGGEPGMETPTGNERILVVDDEAVNAEVLAKILTGLGYEATARTSPVEALETFAKGPEEFDLVITDMTMPVMTGVELAKKILALRPGTPVILCSGFSEGMNAETADALGIRGYVMKPVLRDELAKAVREALRR